MTKIFLTASWLLASARELEKGYTVRHSILFCIELVNKHSEWRVGSSRLTPMTQYKTIWSAILLPLTICLAHNFWVSFLLSPCVAVLAFLTSSKWRVFPNSPRPKVTDRCIRRNLFCCFPDVSWPSTWVFWSLRRSVNLLCKGSSHRSTDTKSKENIAEPTCTMFGT